jgi:hypothetical protein
MDRRFEDLKKFIDKRTRTLSGNHDNIVKQLGEVFKQQHDLTETINNKFSQVAQEQQQFKKDVLDTIENVQRMNGGDL